jgi:glycosyltransferase involved in cell wall biosynthesis
MMNDMVLISGEKNTINIFSEEILCLLKVRNEIVRIQSVLEHHRAIGVDRFFVIDNSSDDGTVEFLKLQPDVALFIADEEFSASSAGMKWLHLILDTFSEDRWSLIVDADELFVYPYFESNNLRTLCSFLDKNSHRTMFAMMLDMYSKEPISKTVHKRQSSLLDTCEYFDSGPYNVYTSPDFPFIKIRGGPRRRCLWDPNTNLRAPALSKVPLVKWKKGYRYTSSTHNMFPAPQTIPEVCGALLHFKFLEDFHRRAKNESSREQYYAGAIQYKQYLKKMDENPNMNLYYEGSVRYRNSSTLLEHRLIKSVTEWDTICTRLSIQS